MSKNVLVTIEIEVPEAQISDAVTFVETLFDADNMALNYHIMAATTDWQWSDEDE
jgi:hypothetical protein